MVPLLARYGEGVPAISSVNIKFDTKFHVPADNVYLPYLLTHILSHHSHDTR